MTEGRGAHSRLAWPPTKADLLAIVLTGALIVTLVGQAWWPAVVLAILLTSTVLSPRAVQARAHGPGIIVETELELDDDVSSTAPNRRPANRPRSRRPAAG